MCYSLIMSFLSSLWDAVKFLFIVEEERKDIKNYVKIPLAETFEGGPYRSLYTSVPEKHAKYLEDGKINRLEQELELSRAKLKDMQAAYKKLQETLVGGNVDREMWRQGMRDAASLVECRNYMMVAQEASESMLAWNIREKVRDELTKLIRHLSLNPEDSIVPLLPISPHAARLVGTMPGPEPRAFEPAEPEPKTHTCGVRHCEKEPRGTRSTGPR